jgi:choline kinase
VIAPGLRAVILAAGRGGRLARVIGDRPKCLARVGSMTLIERQIQMLRTCGIHSITVVTGYRPADVRRVCGGGIDFVHNPHHASTNSLRSLWLVRSRLGDGFVVLNCDVLCHRQLLVDLLTARVDDALLMAGRADDTPYSDEEMKVTVRRGRVVAVAKTLTDEEADGENVGVARFGPAGAAVLVQEMDRLIRAGADREWLPAAFAAFCRRRPLRAVEVRGFPWIEIDFPEDYWRACTEVLPAIEAIGEGRSQTQAVGAPASAGASWRPIHV